MLRASKSKTTSKQSLLRKNLVDMLLGHRQLSDASLKYFIQLFLIREFECEFEFQFVYLVLSSTIFW